MNKDRQVPKLQSKEEVNTIKSEKASWINELIIACTLIPVVDTAVKVYYAANVYGRLVSKVSNMMVRKYMREAEEAIANYIEDANKKSHKITDEEFKQYVEQQVDIAIDRIIGFYDMN